MLFLKVCPFFSYILVVLEFGYELCFVALLILFAKKGRRFMTVKEKTEYDNEKRKRGGT